MPVCVVHLLSLRSAVEDFLDALSRSSLHPIVTSRVVRWIITPTSLSVHPLLDTQWHLILILPTADTALPTPLEKHISARWTVQAGVPTRLLSGFAERNARLLNPRTGDVPPLTGALSAPRLANSAQGLEMTEELRGWMQGYSGGAVSMLNLLAFRPGMKEEYIKYGRAFAESVGSRRGGTAKIVGTVIGDGMGKGVGEGPEGRVWDEVALAHYPSAAHFGDMLASADYQEVNKKYRVGSLRDTFIICTTEVQVGARKGEAKL